MNSIKLLIIEDDKPIIDLIARFLAKDEFEIIHRNNLHDGLQELKTSLPNLVLLDLNLPDGNGLDL